MELFTIHIICSLRTAPAIIFTVNRHEPEDDIQLDKRGNPTQAHQTCKGKSCLAHLPTAHASSLNCGYQGQLADLEILTADTSTSQPLNVSPTSQEIHLQSDLQIPMNYAASFIDQEEVNNCSSYTSHCRQSSLSLASSNCCECNAHISQSDFLNKDKQCKKSPNHCLMQKNEEIHRSKTDAEKSTSSCAIFTLQKNKNLTLKQTKRVTYETSSDSDSVLDPGSKCYYSSKKTFCDNNCLLENDQTKDVIKFCQCQFLCDNPIHVTFKDDNTQDLNKPINDNSCESKHVSKAEEGLCNSNFLCLDLPLTNFGFYSEEVIILF